MQIHKLGKRAKRVDPRTFKLAKYLKPKELPPIPDEVSWVTKIPDIPMYLNDQLGDCVEAAQAHHIGQWTYYATGLEVLFSPADIIKAYEIEGGYLPGQPWTDNGTDMLTALNVWRKQGFAGNPAHKIMAFMSVDPLNHDEVKAAIYLFGSVFTGLALPISAQGQDAWTVADGGPSADGNQPGGWGGHCVSTCAWSPLTATCETWGTRLKMSHNFWDDYVEEAYVMLSADWLGVNGLSPNGFDLQSLGADLAQL